MSKKNKIIFFTSLCFVVLTITVVGLIYSGSNIFRISPWFSNYSGNISSLPAPDSISAPIPISNTKTENLGTIKGKVTIGPICPVQKHNDPCPVPPKAYTSREVILYMRDGITVVQKMNFFPDGTYLFKVPAGAYIIGIPKQVIGGSKNLPKTLIVKSNETIEFNFSIDTGIR